MAYRSESNRAITIDKTEDSGNVIDDRLTPIIDRLVGLKIDMHPISSADRMR